MGLLNGYVIFQTADSAKVQPKARGTRPTASVHGNCAKPLTLTNAATRAIFDIADDEELLRKDV